MRRALEIRRIIQSPNHTDIAISLNNLARLLQKANRHEEAEPLSEEATRIFFKSLGKNHPKSLQSKSNYLRILQERGIPEADIQAIDYALEQLEIV
jgi:hypothetical protein